MSCFERGFDKAGSRAGVKPPGPDPAPFSHSQGVVAASCNSYHLRKVPASYPHHLPATATRP